MKDFISAASEKAKDQEAFSKLWHNIQQYESKVQEGKKQFRDLALAKRTAGTIKQHALDHLHNYLKKFENIARNNGVKVLWAETSTDALKYIDEICQKHNVKTVIKSKSMVTEEVGVREHLEEKGIEVYETDLGELIVQWAKEKPYHIVTPAMHKSREDVARLFNKKLGARLDASHEELVGYARRFLREVYQRADCGITGANFIIADTGGIAITENEGNARMCFSVPKVHVVIAGIEKVIPSLTDLALFFPLLATFGTGQWITTYNSIVFGPRKDDEPDGPKHMYVILLDNGRTRLLSDRKARVAGRCIRCGACLNNCPVYQHIGGHAYPHIYSGPIGKVIVPWFEPSLGYVSFASSLCGKCSEVCPVEIPLDELIQYNRIKYQEEQGSLLEAIAFYLWTLSSKFPFLENIIPAKLKNWFFAKFIAQRWQPRKPLRFPRKTFAKVYKNLVRKHRNPGR